ncbi:hypothetical protein FRC17_000455 [Serendipita sp. 399]|nr:hypothetical protein FRC17_000455 [Serendipita sp. 399]
MHKFTLATLVLTLGHIPGSLQQPPEPSTSTSIPTGLPSTLTLPPTDTSLLNVPSLIPSFTVPFTSLVNNIPQIIQQFGADSSLFSYLPSDAWVQNTTVPGCAFSRGGIRSSNKPDSKISFPLNGNSFTIRTVVGPSPAKFVVSYGGYRQEFSTAATSEQPVCREFTFTVPSKHLRKRDSNIEIQHGGCTDPSQSDCPYNHDGATIRRSTSSAAIKLEIPGAVGVLASMLAFVLL